MRTLDDVAAVGARFYGIHDPNLIIWFTVASLTVEVGPKAHTRDYPDEIDVLARVQLVRDLAKTFDETIIQPTLTRHGSYATILHAGAFHSTGEIAGVPVTVTASLAYHECERLESLGIGGA